MITQTEKIKMINNIENKKQNHKFIKKNDNNYEVKCLVTTGSFYTSVWRKGLIKQNICPCCGEEVK